jgi:MFS family permease
VYAVAFVTRPIGALIYGHVGDTAGRRRCLLWSIASIAVCTTLIGCLPTYEMIGYWAPALLAVLRAIQGLAVGGEFGTAMVRGAAPAAALHRQHCAAAAPCHRIMLPAHLSGSNTPSPRPAGAGGCYRSCP